MPRSWILVSSDHNTFIQFSESLANFRRAWTCAFFSRGTLLALQDFSPSWRSVLPIVLMLSIVLAALRSLTRSFSRVFLGWFLTVLHWNSTRGDLAWSPSINRIFIILLLKIPEIFPKYPLYSRYIFCCWYGLHWREWCSNVHCEAYIVMYLRVILCFFHLRIIAQTFVTFTPSCLAMVL